MSLVQFVNNGEEELEQGDVIVIGRTKAPLAYDPNKESLIFEADVTDTVNDTMVCGVVCGLHVQMRVGSEQEADFDASAKKTVRAKKTKKDDRAVASSLRTFTPEEVENLDITKVPPAQSGYVITQGAYPYCKVDADIASINAGDLLTTSPTKGHAQKVLDQAHAAGAILGKALGSLKKGKGKIPVLIALQ